MALLRRRSISLARHAAVDRWRCPDSDVAFPVLGRAAPWQFGVALPLGRDVATIGLNSEDAAVDVSAQSAATFALLLDGEPQCHERVVGEVEQACRHTLVLQGGEQFDATELVSGAALQPPSPSFRDDRILGRDEVSFVVCVTLDEAAIERGVQRVVSRWRRRATRNGGLATCRPGWLRPRRTPSSLERRSRSFPSSREEAPSRHYQPEDGRARRFLQQFCARFSRQLSHLDEPIPPVGDMRQEPAA